MDLGNYYIDAERSITGTWVEVDADGTALLIGRAAGISYMTHFRSLMTDDYIARERKGEDMQAEQESILTQSLADCVLLGWKGLTIDGEDVKYSKEKAFEILSDPNYTSFRDLVAAHGVNNENFKRKVEEDGLDNVKKS